jgi:hypothetical protein
LTSFVAVTAAEEGLRSKQTLFSDPSASRARPRSCMEASSSKTQEVKELRTFPPESKRKGPPKEEKTRTKAEERKRGQGQLFFKLVFVCFGLYRLVRPMDGVWPWSVSSENEDSQ